MGVPGLFRWVQKNYRSTVTGHPKEANNPLFGECHADNLYIDLNHVIHSCAHSMGLEKEEGPLGGTFEHIKAYLKSLLRAAKPQKLVFIAVDGVAPRAKLTQQRTRRFLAAHRKKLAESYGPKIRSKMKAEARKEILNPESFDPNVISPGTPFMEELHQLLDGFLEEELMKAEEWKGLKVILSPTAEPGEGEHKIMKFIRQQRALPDYKVDTRHVVFGQDADLILLSLLTHEPNFIILREDMQEKNYEDFVVLKINTLRQYLKYGLNPFRSSENSTSNEEEETDVALAEEEEEEVEETELPDFNFERTLEDFVLLTFLMGNDFVPSIPSVDIYDYAGGIDGLVRCYKKVRSENSGFLTSEGTVNLNFLHKVLKEVAEDEIGAYRRISSSNASYKAKKDKKPDNVRKDFNPRHWKSDLNAFEKQGYVSLGEIPRDEELEACLPSKSWASDAEDSDDGLRDMNEEQLTEEYKKRLEKQIAEQLLTNSEVDKVNLGRYKYEERYYTRLMKCGVSDWQAYSRLVSRSYIEGLCWAFAYYTLGPNPFVTNEESPLFELSKKAFKEKMKNLKVGYASWSWCYPYYYAPLIKDLVKSCREVSTKNVLHNGVILAKAQQGLTVQKQAPVTPFVQLLSVLAPESADQCLPKPLAKFLKATKPTTQTSLGDRQAVKSISNLFPEDLGDLIDASGKRWAHTVVVKIPFGDPEKISACALDAGFDSRISEQHLENNEFDSGYLYASKETALAMSSHKDSRPLLDLVVPEFERLDLNDGSWEEDKPIVFAVDIAGIISEPTPCRLLDGVPEEEPLEGHLFKRREPKANAQ